MRRLLAATKERADRGATLVEASLVMPVLILLAIGLAEVGLTFIDWLAVSTASREGARVGAAAGNLDDGTTNADDLILSVVAQASCAIEHGDLNSVRVYKSDSDGNLIGSFENSYTLNSVNCAAGTASWTTNSTGWPAAGRNNRIGNLDVLAVELTFDHNSITGFLPGLDATWTDKAIMRIEPDTRG